MTRYALRTEHGYVSGLFPDGRAVRAVYTADSAFALTWPSATEALLAVVEIDVAMDLVAVER
jgi:hypothetical protein